MVDVESDGPVPGLYSMVCFGAVAVGNFPTEPFHGKCKPISDKWLPEALAISGITREQHLKFPEPVDTMHAFYEWLQQFKNPVFIADNLAYDWQWINYYFHTFYGKNPFGWSGRSLKDLFCGYMNDPYYKWKQYRKTKHTHNPVDDAMGNAEALMHLQKMAFNIKF